MMNPKCQTRPGFDTFSAKSAHLMGLKMRRITRAVSSSRSFDDLVGDGNQFAWNLEAKRLGGLEVDGQFELRWLLNGKIGRLGSLEDAIDIRSRTPEIVEGIRSIRHQATSRDAYPVGEDGRHSVLLCQPH